MARVYRSSSSAVAGSMEQPRAETQSRRERGVSLPQSRTPPASTSSPSPVSSSPTCSAISAPLRFQPLLSSLCHHTDLSVVMPCLNEARTLPGCIESALAGIRAAGLPAEILIADNGSTDGSQVLVGEIAAQLERTASSAEQPHVIGLRVVDVPERGYGAALRGGIAAARGKYVLMADADGSYDFGEIPRFVEKLDAGYDLVMGNRFTGGILPGAMPWHHRYIGNPLLSGLGRILYRTPCRDWHCGLRAFDREKINALHLASTGMEFATEMVIRAQQDNLRITEIPITLHPDGRDRRPHLRSFRDGMRHLRLLWLYMELRPSRHDSLVFTNGNRGNGI